MMFLATLLLATSYSLAGEKGGCGNDKEGCGVKQACDMNACVCTDCACKSCPCSATIGSFDVSYASEEAVFTKACDQERKRDGKCEDKREGRGKRKGGCRKPDSCK